MTHNHNTIMSRTRTQIRIQKELNAKVLELSQIKLLHVWVDNEPVDFAWMSDITIKYIHGCKYLKNSVGMLQEDIDKMDLKLSIIKTRCLYCGRYLQYLRDRTIWELGDQSKYLNYVWHKVKKQDYRGRQYHQKCRKLMGTRKDKRICFHCGEPIKNPWTSRTLHKRCWDELKSYC